MKSLLLALAFLPLSFVAYAQLNTFSEGDVISAEQMNENFQALINSNVLRAKTVNCDDGEKIGDAIDNGYNDITVSGTCNENLLYTVWTDSADTPATDKLAPRYLKITGAEAMATIVDTSSNTKNTISE